MRSTSSSPVLIAPRSASSPLVRYWPTCRRQNFRAIGQSLWLVTSWCGNSCSGGGKRRRPTRLSRIFRGGSPFLTARSTVSRCRLQEQRTGLRDWCCNTSADTSFADAKTNGKQTGLWGLNDTEEPHWAESEL